MDSDAGIGRLWRAGGRGLARLSLCRPLPCWLLTGRLLICLSLPGGLLAASPASPASAGNGLVILQYHHLSDTGPAATRVTPARFDAHLTMLAEGGYTVISLVEGVRRLRLGLPLPPRAVALTFDDGYRSVARIAHPALRKRGWPYTLFVSPAVVDGGGSAILGWKELRRLRAEGATIASHGLHHEHLVRRRNDESLETWRARVRSELAAAQRRLEEELGSVPRWLAYPYGEFSAALLEVVAELQLVGFGQQSGPASRHSDLRALPRFPASGIYSDLETLGVKLKSLPFPVQRIDHGDPLWRAGQQVQVRFDTPAFFERVRCFSGSRTFAPDWLDRQTLVLRPEGLPFGRSRTNCTAPAGKTGRFYWFSQPWITRLADGGWAAEP